MTYQPNTPQFPSDSLAESQKNFLANFQSLFTNFALDHVAMNTAVTAGNHSVVHLIEQDNALQTDDQEISVYTKKAAGQTDQVFLRYQNNGQEIQYTNYQIYSIPSTQFSTRYFTFLPGRIIMYFGTFQNLPNLIFNLKPTVAKDVISVSTTPIGTALRDAETLVASDVTDTKIQFHVNPRKSNAGTASSPYFYMIVANI